MSVGKLVSVAACGSLQLALRWDDGTQGAVDLHELVSARASLRPLMDATIFGSVRLAEDGWSIEWPEAQIDFGAGQLRRWLEEQAGDAMPLGQFLAWAERHKLTVDDIASALGLDRGIAAAYLRGEMPIPKTVMLATEGFSTRQAA